MNEDLDLEDAIEGQDSSDVEESIQYMNAQISAAAGEVQPLEVTPDMEVLKDLIPAHPTREHELKVQPIKKQLFLEALAQCGQVKKAAAFAGIRNLSHLYGWKRGDTKFAEAWQLVMESFGDMAESEAVRRAIEGVKKPVFYKGMVVGHEIKYSDALLMEILRARKGENYRQKATVEHEHKGGIAVIPMSPSNQSSDEDWEKEVKKVHATQQQLLDQAVAEEERARKETEELYIDPDSVLILNDDPDGVHD